MATLAQLQTWLGEAEAARHALATGATTVEIGRDGRKLVYSKTNLSDLNDYVSRLENEIAAKTAEAAGDTFRRRSAIGFYL